MKDIEARHQYIRQQLEENGMIQVQNLAEKLGVTGATIRRDLCILEKQHVLRRGYGNAVPVKGKALNPPLSEKIKLYPSEKRRIALAALELVEENDSFMVTSGSTIEAFVRNLSPVGNHFVVTPSVHLAQLLLKKAGVEVYVLCGKVIKEGLAVRDSTSIECVKRLHCTKLFFSCDGFDPEAGVTSAFLEESQLNYAMMRSCHQRILLADSSKFGKVGIGCTCALKDVDVIISDSGLSRSARREIEKSGVRLIVA